MRYIIKRSLAALLLFITLIMSTLPFFTSCSNGEPAETNGESAVEAQSVEEDNALKKIYLVKSKQASEQITKLVKEAYELITNELGVEAEILIDSETAYEAKEKHYYVIFGDTSYEQSKALSASAEDKKIYYASTEDTVAIYAATDQLMSIASEKLFADCVKDGAFAVGEEYESLTLDASGYVKDKWALNCPAFTRGRLDDATYNVGSGMEKNKDFSYMHIIRTATEEMFKEYIQRLGELGYKKELENEIDGNLYASYVGPLGSNIYVYLTKSKYEIRVIEDNVSTPLSEFNYELAASKDTRLYMFKMGFKSEDCFLIHLADNSWIVIDGGITGQTAGSAYVRDLYNFMAERSSLAEGEKLQIACWYLTHAHEDHMFGFYGLVFEYGSKIQIHRVIDNTAVDGYLKLDYRSYYEKLLEKIKDLNPDVMYLKVHSGMVVNLADTEIEVLYTHEDHINKYMQGDTNPNRDSLVAVFDIAGLTMLETADNFNADVYKLFNVETLATDVLKIAHHYYDTTLDSLYKSLYQTGKVAYCYCSRIDTDTTASTNQAPTVSSFGSRFLKGSASKVYEFYKDSSSVKMKTIAY